MANLLHRIMRLDRDDDEVAIRRNALIRRIVTITMIIWGVRYVLNLVYMTGPDRVVIGRYRGLSRVFWCF